MNKKGQLQQRSINKDKVSPFSVSNSNQDRRDQRRDNSYDMQDSDEYYSAQGEEQQVANHGDYDEVSNSQSFENDFDDVVQIQKQKQFQDSKEASFGNDRHFTFQKKLQEQTQTSKKKRGSKQPQIVVESELQPQKIETPKHNYASNAFDSDTKQLTTVQKRGSRRQSRRQSKLENPFANFAKKNEASLKESVMSLMDDSAPQTVEKPKKDDYVIGLSHQNSITKKSALQYRSRQEAALTSVKKQKSKVSEYTDRDPSIDRNSRLRVSGPRSVASMSIKSKVMNGASQFSSKSRVPTYQDSRYQNKLRMSQSRERQLSSRRSQLTSHSKSQFKLSQLPSLDPLSIKPMGPKVHKQPNFMERLSLGNLAPTVNKKRVVQPPASEVKQQKPRGRRKLQQQKQQPAPVQKLNLQALLLQSQSSIPGFPEKEETDAKISDEESIIQDQMEKMTNKDDSQGIRPSELVRKETEPKRGVLSDYITQETVKSTSIQKEQGRRESSIMEGIEKVIDTFVDKIAPIKEQQQQSPKLKQGQKVVNLDFQLLSTSNDIITEEKSTTKVANQSIESTTRSKSKKGKKKKKQRKSQQLNSVFNFMRDSFISANTSTDMGRVSSVKAILAERAYKEILVLIGMIQDPASTYFHYQLTTIRDRYAQFDNGDKIAYFDQLVQAIEEDNYEPTTALLPQIALILNQLVKIQKLEPSETPGEEILSQATQNILAQYGKGGDKPKQESEIQDLAGLAAARVYSSTGNLSAQPQPQKVDLVNPAILRPKPSLASSSIALTSMTPNTKPIEDDEFMTAFGTTRQNDISGGTIEIGTTLNQRNSLTDRLQSARKRLDQELEEKAEEEKRAAEKIRFLTCCEKTKDKLRDMFHQVIAQDPLYEQPEDEGDDALFRVLPDKLFDKFLESKKKANNDMQDFIEYEYLMAREKLQTVARQNQAKMAQQPDLQGLRRKSKEIKLEKMEESKEQKDVSALEALVQSVRSEQENDEEYEYATETVDDLTQEDKQEATEPLLLTSNSGQISPDQRQSVKSEERKREDSGNPFDYYIKEDQERESSKQSTQTKVKNPFRDYFTPEGSDDEREEVLDLPEAIPKEDPSATPEYFSQNTFGGSELKLNEDRPVRSKKVEIKRNNLMAAEEILAARTKPQEESLEEVKQYSDSGALNQLLGSLKSSELESELERSEKQKPIKLNQILSSSPLTDLVDEVQSTSDKGLQQPSETSLQDIEEVRTSVVKDILQPSEPLMKDIEEVKEPQVEEVDKLDKQLTTVEENEPETDRKENDPDQVITTVEEAVSFAIDADEQPKRMQSFSEMQQEELKREQSFEDFVQQKEIVPVVSKKLERNKSDKPFQKPRKSIFQSSQSNTDVHEDLPKSRKVNPLMLLLGSEATKNILDVSSQHSGSKKSGKDKDSKHSDEAYEEANGQLAEINKSKHSDEAYERANSQLVNINKDKFEIKSDKESDHSGSIIKQDFSQQQKRRSGSVMNIAPLNSTGKMNNFGRILPNDFMSRLTAKEAEEHRNSFIGGSQMGYFENGVYQDPAQIMEQAIERASQRHFDMMSQQSKSVQAKQEEARQNAYEKMSVKTDNRKGNIFNKKRDRSTSSNRGQLHTATLMSEYARKMNMEMKLDK